MWLLFLQIEESRRVLALFQYQRNFISTYAESDKAPPNDSNHYGGICLGGKTRPGNSPGLYTNDTLSQKVPFVNTNFQRQRLIVVQARLSLNPHPLTAEAAQSIAVGSAGILPAFLQDGKTHDRAGKAPSLQTSRDVSQSPVAGCWVGTGGMFIGWRSFLVAE
jgi:hypothetical protein